MLVNLAVTTVLFFICSLHSSFLPLSLYLRLNRFLGWKLTGTIGDKELIQNPKIQYRQMETGWGNNNNKKKKNHTREGNKGLTLKWVTNTVIVRAAASGLEGNSVSCVCSLHSSMPQWSMPLWSLGWMSAIHYCKGSNLKSYIVQTSQSITSQNWCSTRPEALMELDWHAGTRLFPDDIYS